jgi:hypothetical protein
LAPPSLESAAARDEGDRDDETVRMSVAIAAERRPRPARVPTRDVRWPSEIGDDPRAGPERADRIARDLTTAGGRIAVAQARAAAPFVAAEGWTLFGYARASDYAREVLDRSSRWICDLAVLGRGLTELSGLAAAVLGSDGGAPIGRVAAIDLARIARPETLGRWIALARTSTALQLKQELRRARESGSHAPGGDPARPADRRTLPDDADGEPSCRLRFAVPAPVKLAFEETHDLHRAVSGYEATVVEFVEALVAENTAGTTAGSPSVRPGALGACTAHAAPPAHARDGDHGPASPRSASSGPNDGHDVVRGLAGVRRSPRAQRRASEHPSAVDAAVRVLRRLDRVAQDDCDGNPARQAERIRELVGLEDEVERALGRLLAEMDAHDDFRGLGFTSMGEYVEERLGISRRTAERRCGILGALRHLPAIRTAYEKGEVGLRAAWLLRGILGPRPVTLEFEAAWLAQARAVTIKRLRDERRRLGLVSAGLIAAGAGAIGWPASDAEWQASLRRTPGLGLVRVVTLGRAAGAAIPYPERDTVFLRLELPADLAEGLLQCIDLERARLRSQATGWLASRCDGGERSAVAGVDRDPNDLSPARAAAVACVRAKQPIPPWVGIQSLLEDFVATWDDPKGFPKREWDATYDAWGWRCQAPGCTGRRRIEDHHVRYRSHGGSDAMWNQLCLCAWHHRQGEHGVLARCRGTAPLDVTWRLGRRDLGTRFRNERRLR